jgi:hypothetical protein
VKLHIDLCCGLGGWQAPFETDPDWRSVGIDIRDDLAADVVADVTRLPIKDDVQPTLLTASPPCQEFSTAWNRWVPLGERDPDLSIWRACERAVDRLDPEWWVIENVAGAQHWFGEADKSCYPWMLWGHFPPFDAPDLRKKGNTPYQDRAETAKIPERLARALKGAVEVWGRV